MILLLLSVAYLFSSYHSSHWNVRDINVKPNQSIKNNLIIFITCICNVIYLQMPDAFSMTFFFIPLVRFLMLNLWYLCNYLYPWPYFILQLFKCILLPHFFPFHAFYSLTSAKKKKLFPYCYGSYIDLRKMLMIQSLWLIEKYIM